MVNYDKQECKIEIDFGIPKHGWLPMSFQWQEFKLELGISNVPIDPMEQLCDALIQINKGIKTPIKVIWHLEPYCYYFQLEQIAGKYNVKIFESEEFESPMTVAKEIEGNFEQIILPLYRGIKKFNSYSYKSPHWNEMNSSRIEELTELIKTKRPA